MKKVYNYGIFILLLSFIFINKVDAECSYQERKQLLNEAKSVDINFDVVSEEKEMVGINPNTEEEETFKTTLYTFKMNISSMTNNMFAKITNDFDSSEIIINYDDMQNGMYSFNIENTTDIINYYVNFYSTNNNCYAYDITTRTVKKSKINPVYFYSVCSNVLVSDSEYCKLFIDKNFSKTEYEIVQELNNIINNKDADLTGDNSNNILSNVFSFLTTYWYFFLIFIIVLVVIVVVLLTRKKRSKL